MELTNSRIPNPDQVKEEFFYLPYEAGRREDADGFWEPIVAYQRYVKVRLGPQYVQWALDADYPRH